MNPVKRTIAVVPFLAVATWGGASFAQEVAPPVVATEPVAPSETRSETVTERGGPSMSALSSGVITLGATYGAAAIVAATSDRDSDHRMFVPVAGPWMALFDRGGCGGDAGRSCSTETAYNVLIVADGVGQALGAFMIIGAFLHPETRTTTHSTTALATKPVVRVLPASFGGAGYGMQALGTF